MPKENNIILHKTGVLFNDEKDFDKLRQYIHNLQAREELAHYSELIDLHHYSKKRHYAKIKAALRSESMQPFVFVVCLN